ncbi:MAG: PLP-dependent aminotransferase family protein [Candidatus Thorarchaeota archaeon]|nr:PLP-dependent aminotransferase family protein [Candidatus Thorarchaeota archaeon]
MAEEDSYAFASWTGFIPASQIRELLKYDVEYYFAGGKPGIIPTDTFAKILSDLSKEYVKKPRMALEDLNYGPTGGYKWFRKTLAKRLCNKRDINIDCEEDWERVSITSGSQQALYAVLDTMIDPGDVIVTPSPAYLGFLGPAVKLGARVITVPTDLDGIIPEYVDKAISLSKAKFGKHPDIVYVVPDSDNPKGTTLPMKRRRELFDICENYNLILLEDSAYAEIQFKETDVKPIKSLDKDNNRVAYLGTTSKEAAVLRVGYSVMPDSLRDQVLKDKGYLDLCTSTLIQRILDEYYRKYIDDVLIEGIKGYRKRYEAMAEAIDESFPPGKRTDPTGGFFIWWQSEKEFDARDFLKQEAMPNDILYVPGTAFYPITGYSLGNGQDKLVPSKPEHNTMRLGYSYAEPDVISEGICRLGDLLTEHLQ